MLNREDNDLLTRVENGAAMGELMRRYWLPTLLSEDLETDGAPRRVQLLGEKLVVFRDSEGKVGVMDEYCPHRGASLALARNENCALQCLYHGWRINRDGKVVETPSEPGDSTFKDRIRHLAYPVREEGGIVWSYLGAPDEQPEFPAFEWTTKPLEQTYTLRIVERCNWAQALEGVLDSAHIGFLHNDLVKRIAREGEDAYTGGGGLIGEIIADGHPRLDVQNTPWGLTYGASRKATTLDGNPVSYVRTSHFVAPIWGLFPAPEGWSFQQGFVPIDDYTTMFFFVHHRTDGATIDDEYRAKIRHWAGMDDLAEDGGFIHTIDNWWHQDREAMKNGSFSGLKGAGQVEDFAAQESMGPIYDRSREHLGTSDLVAIRMRRILLDAARGKAALPALGGDFDYRGLRAAEGLIDVGADWRTVGSDTRVG